MGARRHNGVVSRIERIIYSINLSSSKNPACCTRADRYWKSIRLNGRYGLHTITYYYLFVILCLVSSTNHRPTWLAQHWIEIRFQIVVPYIATSGCTTQSNRWQFLYRIAQSSSQGHAVWFCSVSTTNSFDSRQWTVHGSYFGEPIAFWIELFNCDSFRSTHRHYVPTLGGWLAVLVVLSISLELNHSFRDETTTMDVELTNKQMVRICPEFASDFAKYPMIRKKLVAPQADGAKIWRPCLCYYERRSNCTQDALCLWRRS